MGNTKSTKQLNNTLENQKWERHKTKAKLLANVQYIHLNYMPMYRPTTFFIYRVSHKNDPLCCFAKISITNGTFSDKFYTHIQQKYTCWPFWCLSSKYTEYDEWMNKILLSQSTWQLDSKAGEPALIWAHKIQYKWNNKSINIKHNLTDQN